MRRASSLPIIASTALGALAGVMVGVLVVQRHGSVGSALRRLGRRLADEIDAEEGPPLSVYEQDRLVHDDNDPESADDALETDESEAAAATELEERVLDAFLNDPVLGDCEIEISAQSDGIVSLRGWVESPAAVEHAATIAGGVPGVIGLSNNVRVRRERRVRTS